jgi:hypothetical protein
MPKYTRKTGHGPRPPVMDSLIQITDIFSQSDPIRSGFNFYPSNQSYFRKGQIAWRVHLPASINSLKSEQVKALAKTTNPLAQADPQLLFLRVSFPIPAVRFVRRNGSN